MLIVLQQIVMFILVSKLSKTVVDVDEIDHQSPSHFRPQRVKKETPTKILNDHSPTVQPESISNTITMAGISYSDNATSDFAIQFLVEAACNYGIQSFILLRERDATMSLTKKVAALAHHMQSLPRDGVVSHPKCIEWIHISQSPSEDYLLNMTRSHIIHGALGEELDVDDSTTLNNPLDRDSRIARIKRSREYQRGELHNVLELQNKLQDWKMNSVIAVLDLDMFAYPSPSNLIETAKKYILPSPTTADTPDATVQTPKEQPRHDKAKFHAICSNGIFVRVKEGDYYDMRYYDTYSTILLPNLWLYREPRPSKQKKEKMDKDKTKQQIMNQTQTFHYILKEGRSSKSSGAIGDNYYEPLPVRSCFGGLTLYRTDIWLDSDCRYDMYHKDDADFTSSQYRHACEHVVFHECLRRERMMVKGRNRATAGGDGGWDGFNIAVKPDMTTLWHTM